MDEGKEYLIRIFIKKCTILSSTKDNLEFYFKWCASTYNVSEEKLEELKKKFTINEYINRIIPVLDKYFLKEELKNIIQFYSTDVGKKLLNFAFLKEVGEVSKNMEAQIEQEFSLNNNKS